MALTKEQKQAIESYANQIVTLKKFVEMVRKRPGMYLGPIGNDGFLNMIREIYQNSVDQVVRQDSPADFVSISFDERTHDVVIEDNGMGIPYGHMIRIFEKEHTSSHFEPTPGVYQSGLHGVGSKVVNAMSSKFSVQSFILGEGRQVDWVDGVHVTEEVIIENPNNKQGTVIMFTPSIEALGELTVTVRDVQDYLMRLIPLGPLGLKIIFNTIDKDGNPNSITLINTEGILDHIKTRSPLLKEPIYITNEEPARTMKMECGINFDSEFNASVVGFANFCPTFSGTHIKGFTDGVTTWFKKYMNTIYLAKTNENKKKSPITIEHVDILSILKGVIHALSIEPNFTGQAKENLSNPGMVPYIRKAVIDGLDEWSAKNPQDLQRVCKFIKDIAETRISETSKKTKLAVKYASAFGGYPAKFVKPSGPKSMWKEFYIVEGDSALGTGKNARINQIQGLLPVRGNLPNAFNKSERDILANDECSAIFNIIAGGYGKSFDLSKVIWEKVGVMADADIDGGHISTLFLILMLVYCKPLVEDGRVFKCVPPLYLAKIKGKDTYFTDQLDFNKYRQEEFFKKHVVTHYDGTPITTNEALKLLFTNEDYVYWINIVSTTYALDPVLLETILINRESTIKQLSGVIRNNNRFRFVKEFKEVNNTIYIDGLVQSKCNTVFLNDKLLKECKSIIDIINQNTDFYFNIDGKLVSLYELMSEFEKDKPKVQRFKGLGEMDGAKLRASTLDPEGSRQIIRYSAKDIVNEVESLRYLNSNMNLIAEGVKVSRIDLLD